ncbi:hypothetical protein CDD83_8044 [Cordyceps sp. RAO-2017]|nr:hypothetical protein CDD83_8044 [Cordyceps sp. RAO-2017]
MATHTTQLVKGSYKSFHHLIPRDCRPALWNAASGTFISHRQLYDFVADFSLPGTAPPRPVVAIALPNGPLLAAVCFAVTTYYTAAPINPVAGAEQFRADVTLAGAQLILTTADEYDKLQLGEPWVRDGDIRVVCVSCDDGGNIELVAAGEGLPRPQRPKPNEADDISLLLFTSGTSGKKKVVPITTHSLIVGIVGVIDSWGLTSTDICLNMMPLYHIGGLVRNVFAPVFSAGSTVCCAAFDPDLFWDVMEEMQPTWYYASPSMHSLILEQASQRPAALQRSRMRLVCNAAGGLLPTLAYRLRETFRCVVLPSYGMTELDREGTSGVSCGPELTVLDSSEAPVRPGTIGRVCVRGEPVFPGYLRPDGSIDKETAFTSHGWFDTGDLGYMDPDGYLYITGRSKEVVNRGGELISPFEVENAIVSAAQSPESPIHGRVAGALAFSVQHEVLQEVVGVVLLTPVDQPRVDLRALHQALESSLQQVKWPVLIVFMDDLPRKNNKVLRIGLSRRLGLLELGQDDVPYLQRHWEADCPPVDTDLSVPIPSRQCSADYRLLSEALDAAVPVGFCHCCRTNAADHAIEAIVAPASTEGSKTTLSSGFADELRRLLSGRIHNYLVPDRIHVLSEPLPMNQDGHADEAHLQALVDEMLSASLDDDSTSRTETEVAKVFAQVLGRYPGEIPLDLDFFSLGGDSLRAGRLVSTLRHEFNVQVPISIVFGRGTVRAVAAHIDKLKPASSDGECEEDKAAPVGCADGTKSSTNPFLMALQLSPLVVFCPLRYSFQWAIFIAMLSQSHAWPTAGSPVGLLANLVFSIIFARAVLRLVAPFFGIAAKWLIVGRYAEGLYPMWGGYHTRWWLVQKIEAICGKGIFNINDSTLRIYYILMGARIGRRVRLQGAALGEWDLLDIGDDAILAGGCVCRPFAVEGNTTMYLGRIKIGEKSSINVSSVLAPGSDIPPNTHIGPNSSSWEMADATEENGDLNARKASGPHWLLTVLLTAPLLSVAWILSLLPWIAGLLGMVLPGKHVVPFMVRGTLAWFTTDTRLAFHYLALALKVIGPFFLLGFAVLLRLLLDGLFGKLESGSSRGRGAWATWRQSLMKTLMPMRQLQQVTAMFGKHYEATSIVLRLLGSRIGKRVYWPGTGPYIGDYHLLDIGDDVVFGSRSYLLTSDGVGSDTITVRDGAMIADRVCLLPGADVGRQTTMGSGALGRKGKKYDDGATYVGSQAGDAVLLSTGRDGAERSRRSRALVMPGEKPSDDTLAETASPFGRAFYYKLAPYYVFSPSLIFFYSVLTTVLAVLYWNLPIICSTQIAHTLMSRYIPVLGFWAEVATTLGIIFPLTAILMTIQAVVALMIVIAAKWSLLGRRQPGNYDWDKSSYCQRWQLFLAIEKIRQVSFSGQGILGLLTGTHWMVLYFRAMGATIGDDCALFANGCPSVMFTEPDLISLGSRVAVDDASIVAHVNTRGTFNLNRIEVGNS